MTDHNPEQVAERLRAFARCLVSANEARESLLLWQAAYLLDYYASVVEGLVSEGAVEAAQDAHEASFGTAPAAANILTAICAALQHAQSIR